MYDEAIFITVTSLEHEVSPEPLPPEYWSHTPAHSVSLKRDRDFSDHSSQIGCASKRSQVSIWDSGMVAIKGVLVAGVLHRPGSIER